MRFWKAHRRKEKSDEGGKPAEADQRNGGHERPEGEGERRHPLLSGPLWLCFFRPGGDVYQRAGGEMGKGQAGRQELWIFYPGLRPMDRTAGGGLFGPAGAGISGRKPPIRRPDGQHPPQPVCRERPGIFASRDAGDCTLEKRPYWRLPGRGQGAGIPGNRLWRGNLAPFQPEMEGMGIPAGCGVWRSRDGYAGRRHGGGPGWLGERAGRGQHGNGDFGCGPQRGQFSFGGRECIGLVQDRL